VAFLVSSGLVDLLTDNTATAQDTAKVATSLRKAQAMADALDPVEQRGSYWINVPMHKVSNLELLCLRLLTSVPGRPR
jgi:hypothetical protein